VKKRAWRAYRKLAQTQAAAKQTPAIMAALLGSETTSPLKVAPYTQPELKTVCACTNIPPPLLHCIGTDIIVVWVSYWVSISFQLRLVLPFGQTKFLRKRPTYNEMLTV
jgi:hypothetical protein